MTENRTVPSKDGGKGSRKARLVLRLVFVLVVAAGAWVLFDTAFVHGIIVGLFAAVGILVGGVTLLTRRLKKKMGDQLKPPPIPSDSWDYDMEGTDMEGAQRHFSEFEGRVLVLNFWATWCGPCIVEMPSLQNLRDRTSGLDVGFAFVTNEPVELVQKMIEKRGWDLPIFLVEGDRPECFSTAAIPATFILGKDGRIVMRHMGSAKWDAEEIVSFVQGLVSTPG